MPLLPENAFRVPCSAGEATVTVAPGSGFPPEVTVPVSDDVFPCAQSRLVPRKRPKAARKRMYFRI